MVVKVGDESSQDAQNANAFTARTHLGQPIKRAAESGETYVLTKKGRPKVVILGIEEYEDLLEIAEEQRDKEAVEDDFRELPTKKIQGQVLKALERIRTDPHRGQKLTGAEVGAWRYGVGDCRIRYDIERHALVLHIVRHRKEVYRR